MTLGLRCIDGLPSPTGLGYIPGSEDEVVRLVGCIVPDMKWVGGTYNVPAGIGT